MLLIIQEAIRNCPKEGEAALKWVAAEARGIIGLLMSHLVDLEKVADLAEIICTLLFEIINLVKVPEQPIKKPKKTPDDPDYDSNESSSDEDPFKTLPPEHGGLFSAILYALMVRHCCSTAVWHVACGVWRVADAAPFVPSVCVSVCALRSITLSRFCIASSAASS